MPIHIELASAAKNVLPQKSPGISIAQRLLHDDRQIPVFPADIDVTTFRAHRQSSDHHAFDHRMRILLEDQPVFTRAGLTLVAIAQHVLRLGRRLGNERPFHPRRKTRAAAPAQRRVLDLVDNRVRPHAQRLLHGFVAVELKIAINLCRALTKAPGDDPYFIGMGNQLSHLIEDFRFQIADFKPVVFCPKSAI